MTLPFDLSLYNFSVPDELIAQEPVFPRDASRMLVVDRPTGAIRETVFSDIGKFVRSGDVIVINDTQVYKARIFGVKESGGKVELLVVRPYQGRCWEVLARPSKRLRIGGSITCPNNVRAVVRGVTDRGSVIVEFDCPDVRVFLDSFGDVPLPAYIKKNVADPKLYQTVYASKVGAVAAPTAGFHFTPELLADLQKQGVVVVKVTLHCGPATFRPIQAADIRGHVMDSEYIEVSSRVCACIRKAKHAGNRIIAVGTTCIRTLESAAADEAVIEPAQRLTNLYITPGYRFRVVDSVITNFHTPYSTNLVLVGVLCGYPLLQRAYQYAIDARFRFYSFGDAMIII